jgi:uncharacterized membrane protein
MDVDKQEQRRKLAIEKKKCDDLMSGEFVTSRQPAVSNSMHSQLHSILTLTIVF